MMNLILLIGTIFMAVKGCNMFQILIFWAICGTASQKFVDSNRRGKWW